jgi:hypothetical protein
MVVHLMQLAAMVDPGDYLGQMDILLQVQQYMAAMAEILEVAVVGHSFNGAIIIQATVAVAV